VPSRLPLTTSSPGARTPPVSRLPLAVSELPSALPLAVSSPRAAPAHYGVSEPALAAQGNAEGHGVVMPAPSVERSPVAAELRTGLFPVAAEPSLEPTTSPGTDGHKFVVVVTSPTGSIAVPAMLAKAVGPAAAVKPENQETVVAAASDNLPIRQGTSAAPIVAAVNSEKPETVVSAAPIVAAGPPAMASSMVAGGAAGAASVKTETLLAPSGLVPLTVRARKDPLGRCTWSLEEKVGSTPPFVYVARVAGRLFFLRQFLRQDGDDGEDTFYAWTVPMGSPSAAPELRKLSDLEPV
jgi:hypothetical protein